MNRLSKICGFLVAAILCAAFITGCGLKDLPQISPFGNAGGKNEASVVAGIEIKDGKIPQSASIEDNQPIELISFEYNPGYSDMNGALHHEWMLKNENGEWIIESHDRESISEHIKITTYAVSMEDVRRFDTFIREKDVVSLGDREDSGEFVTDYNPWHYVIKLADPTSDGLLGDRYSIEEYRQYSDEDYALLKELDQLFKDIHGEIISEKVDKNF